MKRAGDYLAAIIDVNLYNKAKSYSGFFYSWDQITQGCGIAAAAGHSRIRELERGILVVEADHPGWVQILQTKARQILDTVQRRFPELQIRGVSFTLSKSTAGILEETEPPSKVKEAPLERDPVRELENPEEGRIKAGTWDQIEDPDLKKSLKNLERSIKNREKSAPSRAGGKK
jgi:hypothetical protein